jgi:hypothetical protein
MIELQAMPQVSLSTYPRGRGARFKGKSRKWSKFKQNNGCRTLRLR